MRVRGGDFAPLAVGSTGMNGTDPQALGFPNLYGYPSFLG